jgi:hypothetical protein
LCKEAAQTGQEQQDFLLQWGGKWKLETDLQDADQFSAAARVTSAEEVLSDII